jgi:molybdenum cofactor cytidylyltransferase
VIAGLILAAGAGTRFSRSGSPPGAGSEGGFKLLASLGGRPLLSFAVEAACAVAELDRVVVVLGSGASEVLERVPFGRAEPVVCPEWSRGQAASLRCGLAALSDADRVIVTLGDEPGITPEVIRRFLDAPPGSRAVYGGRPGHPVLLGQHHMSELSSLTGDHGARDLLRGGPTIECGELWSGRDVDTPEDLEAIRDETRALL